MAVENALDKTNRINLLFDFYESLLTEKQQMFLKYYFHDNYSFGEIAEAHHISRQAVYEHIKRAESCLEDYEEKLHLLGHYNQRIRYLDEIKTELSRLHHGPAAVRIRHLAQCIQELDN